MRASVIGLGKIGLPMAVQIASSGVETVGVDINEHVVSSINEGVPHFSEEPELGERLSAAVAAGKLRATLSTRDAVASADVVVVVVPLVIDESNRPDFTVIDLATTAVAEGLQENTLVIFETTMPVGTTRTRLAPMLESGSGLEAGRDFWLAYSPERVSSGTVFRDMRRYPKLVGGVNAPSGEAAAAFYEKVLEFDERPDLDRANGVWLLSNSETAELAKLSETLYRDVNIALANDIATHAERVGIDAWEVISASNSQPYSHIHQPGIAVGGHCIPVYPYLYMQSHQDSALASRSRIVNREQPDRLVARLEKAIGPLAGVEVAILGAAYRGGVKETAFSGVFDVVSAVRERKGIALVHDPLFDTEEIVAMGFDTYALGDECQVAIIQTDHAQYRRLTPGDLPGCRGILDGRAILDNAPWRAEGVPIITVGVA